MRRLFCLVALALVFSRVPALAQQGTTEVRGVVADAQGAVLPGVTVTVRNEDTGMFREVVTNQDGTYFVSGIVPGRYSVSVTLEGFRPYSQHDLILSIGRTTTLNIQLEVGTVAEAVTVTGESPVVDITSKEVGGNISSRELTDLPSINRNYIGFVGLLPGIVANVSTESFGSDSINVNGQDARNNNYLLDGANNNDDVIGQRAGTQARTPLEAIQEFQVLTNQFDAEFGRTMGAVINAVTKQGTNRFRGSAFTFLQDASLTKKDYFAEQNNLAKPDTKQQWFGGTIGGPIVRDKAHFFVSVERLLIDEGVTVNVPAAPEFNATTTEKTRVWNTLVRFDHQINPTNTWGVRWLREYSPQYNQVINAAPRNATLPASREEDDLDQTVVGSLSSVLSNTRVNTLRVAFTQEDVAFANPCFNGNGRNQLACEPRLNFLTYFAGNSDVAQARVNNAFQIEDTFSWFVPGRHGDHDLKFGVQFQYSSADFDGQDNMNGTFTFRTNSFNPNDPSTYPERLSIRVPGAVHYYLPARYYSAFAQDKWKFNDRLTLSLGLRYDVEDIAVSESGAGVVPGAGEAAMDTNNIAPRIGFSFDPNGSGRSVVRGGYGLFYDKTHFELITALITTGFFSNSFTALFPANAADPGPSRGQLPSDEMLRNGPTVNFDLLNRQYPPGSTVANTGNVFVDSPDRRIPYTHQLTVGYERQLGIDVSASVDYVHAIGRDQFMSKDLNAGLRVSTSRTGRIVRPLTGYPNQQIQQRLNLGETDYDALQMQVEKRFSHNFSARVAYTLSYSRGNTSGSGIPNSNFQVLDDMRLDLNEGPTDFDRRHNLVISGSVMVPKTHGMTVSWVARALSGLPFTIQDSTTDPDQNGVLFDPLPSGSYAGSGARNNYSAENDGGRNGARGPGFVQLDTRFGWRLNIGGGRTVDVFGEVFNLTNRANFASPTGDRFSTNFLVLTGLREGGVPRTGQIGIRFGF
ncbi:MAG TPA: TonB-dependent receptor [Vicinamibacterales bacterium]|nr:TonB-dependent receptor [Vicinamibacterales bacterium]